MSHCPDIYTQLLHQPKQLRRLAKTLYSRLASHQMQQLKKHKKATLSTNNSQHDAVSRRDIHIEGLLQHNSATIATTPSRNNGIEAATR